MAKNGYVYILINPSLKGLLKVGQTQKDPEERARELSQGTGVPTQFIVAYKEEFNNCELAEQMVHVLLEEDGYRINKNREFFEAEISDVIRKIMFVKEHLSTNEYAEEYKDDLDNGIEFSDTGDLFSDFEEAELETTQQSNPWDAVEEIANTAYYGYNDELEDYGKAYEYYTKAFKLGSPTAAKQLAIMYELGRSVRENKSTALTFFKEAVARGNTSCWANIGALYVESNISNAKKAYKKYLAEEDVEAIKSSIDIYYIVFRPLYRAFKYDTIKRDDFMEIFSLLAPYKAELLLEADYYCNYLKNSNLDYKDSSIAEMKKEIVIIEENL